MSRFLLALMVGMATVATMPLSGQAPQPDAKAITVLNGCLRQSRADTTTANTKGVIYTLEADAQKSPASPAPEGSGKAKADGRFALSFEQSVDLSKHVNHRVEVRGRIISRPATDAAAAKPLPGAAEQMFHVTELTMLSPKCER